MTILWEHVDSDHDRVQLLKLDRPRALVQLIAIAPVNLDVIAARALRNALDAVLAEHELPVVPNPTARLVSGPIDVAEATNRASADRPRPVGVADLERLTATIDDLVGAVRGLAGAVSGAGTRAGT